MTTRNLFFFAFSLLFALVFFTACEREDPNEMEEEYGMTNNSLANRVDQSINGDSACFTFTFPLEITVPDGPPQTFNSAAELLVFLEVWEESYPDAGEYPAITYPVEVTLGDGNLLSIANEESLDDLLDTCEEDYEEDDDDEEDDD